MERRRADKGFRSFTEPEFRAPSTYARALDHPLDLVDGYFNMRLRYASRDLLQALGHIPCQYKQNIT
jgi:hypothetical protein